MLPKNPSKPFAALNALVLTAVVITAWTRLDSPIWFLIPFALLSAGLAGIVLWRAMQPGETSEESQGDTAQ